MAPGFSIVICTYNGASRLVPTLEHLAALTIPAGKRLEVVLVDNASTDGTGAFVQQFWEAIGAPFPLMVLRENRPGKGYAIETGYDAAQYSHILTVDDDNWLAANYLVVAQRLLHQHPDVGVLQGRNTAVFESTPPAWLVGFEYTLVIGSPVKECGYFARDNFRVWGAGMVIERASWLMLRKLGFAFLTSKVPGKASGEDNETAMALMLLGRKVYYSDELYYQHFMPASRVKWETLVANYEVAAYVNYHFLLYALAIDAYNKNQPPSNKHLRAIFWSFFLRVAKQFTFKQNIAYWVWPRKKNYDLGLSYYYKMYSVYANNYKNTNRDFYTLKKWMFPLLKQSEEKFDWPLEI